MKPTMLYSLPDIMPVQEKISPIWITASTEELFPALRSTELIEKEMMPWVKFVTTKEALSRYAAKFPPQKVLRENTISAVKEVLDSDLSKIPLYEVATPIKLGFEFKSTAMADTVAQIPRMKRLSGTEVEIICDDMHELECGISAITGLAGTSN